VSLSIRSKENKNKKTGEKAAFVEFIPEILLTKQ